MLKIINELGVFFEDCYKEFSVREYSRIMKISPPTASKILKNYEKEGFLVKREDRGYLFFKTNKENSLIRDFSRIYWKIKFEKSDLIEFFEKELINTVVILFGSLSNTEATLDSDIDIAIFSVTKKQLNLEKYEKIFKREIQIFRFDKLSSVKNKELLNNILNGYKLTGDW